MTHSRSKSRKGQGLVEYALILTLVAVIVIAVLITVGPQIGGIFSSVNNSLSGIASSSGSSPQPTAQPTAGPTAAPTVNPACASLLVAYQNASAAYCGNKSQCPAAYTNVVNAYYAYYGAGCP